MIAELHNLSSLVLAVSWVVIYILMIRRGFLDKSYGMPMIALCLNISWEFNFTFLTDIETVYRMTNGFFFLFDFGVLYTCFRFGRGDFEWPLMRKWFPQVLAASLAISFAGVFLFVRAFDDTYGGLFAALNTPVYSALLISMLLRRNSVKGQSLYIGLAIFIGDAGAYIPTLYAHQVGWASTPLLWIHTFMITTLVLHAAYIVIYWHIARRDGINPWKRL